MNIADFQNLAQKAGYYSGSVDGRKGPKTLEAVDRLISKHAKLCTSNPALWETSRRIIAAGQIVLHFAGYEPGAIDGYAGGNTRAALSAFYHVFRSQQAQNVPRTPVPEYAPVKSVFPRQAGCQAFYGTPGSSALISALATYKLPLPMRIDWNLDQQTSSIRLHKKCGDSAIAATGEIIRHYGEKEWRRLGLDRNAGTYNHRKMRGGTSWSMHAYGCAWDFYAKPNDLNTRKPKALFSKPAYVAFFNIWEAHGWTSLGRAIDRDYMHVQAASL